MTGLEIEVKCGLVSMSTHQQLKAVSLCDSDPNNFWSQSAWVQIPHLPLTMTLGKFPNLSVPRFSHR